VTPGACERLAAERDTRAGTILAVFQPAEELGAGAQAMVDHGLYTRFPPRTRGHLPTHSIAAAQAAEQPDHLGVVALRRDLKSLGWAPRCSPGQGPGPRLVAGHRVG
jgi:metal-dependent amidase/aminoacylase/carboxypeptidase family protein